MNVIQYEYKQACFCFFVKGEFIFVQKKSESNKN